MYVKKAKNIQKLMESSTYLNSRKVNESVANQIDLYYYIQDIFDLGKEFKKDALGNTLMDQLLAHFILPVLIASILPEENQRKSNRKIFLSKKLALFLLAQVFLVFRHEGFVNAIATCLIDNHPPLLSQWLMHAAPTHPIKSPVPLTHLLYPRSKKMAKKRRGQRRASDGDAKEDLDSSSAGKYEVNETSQNSSNHSRREKKNLPRDMNLKARSAMPDIGPVISPVKACPNYDEPLPSNEARSALLSLLRDKDENMVYGVVAVLVALLKNPVIDKELLCFGGICPQQYYNKRRLLKELTSDDGGMPRGGSDLSDREEEGTDDEFNRQNGRPNLKIEDFKALNKDAINLLLQRRSVDTDNGDDSFTPPAPGNAPPLPPPSFELEQDLKGPTKGFLGQYRSSSKLRDPEAKEPILRTDPKREQEGDILRDTLISAVVDEGKPKDRNEAKAREELEHAGKGKDTDEPDAVCDGLEEQNVPHLTNNSENLHSDENSVTRVNERSASPQANPPSKTNIESEGGDQGQNSEIVETANIPSAPQRDSRNSEEMKENISIAEHLEEERVEVTQYSQGVKGGAAETAAYTSRDVCVPKGGGEENKEAPGQWNGLQANLVKLVHKPNGERGKDHDDDTKLHTEAVHGISITSTSGATNFTSDSLKAANASHAYPSNARNDENQTSAATQVSSLESTATFSEQLEYCREVVNSLLNALSTQPPYRLVTIQMVIDLLGELVIDHTPNPCLDEKDIPKLEKAYQLAAKDVAKRFTKKDEHDALLNNFQTCFKNMSKAIDIEEILTNAVRVSCFALLLRC